MVEFSDRQTAGVGPDLGLCVADSSGTLPPQGKVSQLLVMQERVGEGSEPKLLLQLAEHSTAHRLRDASL